MMLLKSLLLVAPPFLFALGITLPLITFESLYFFTDSPSLVDMVVSLSGQGSYALAGIIVLFSILFPLVKMIVVAMELMGGAVAAGKMTLVSRLLPYLAKWSLMDVLLVALVIVAAKSSGVAAAFTQPGLWFYAGSTLSVSLLHALVRHKASTADRLGPTS